MTRGKGERNTVSSVSEHYGDWAMARFLLLTRARRRSMTTQEAVGYGAFIASRRMMLDAIPNFRIRRQRAYLLGLRRGYRARAAEEAE